MSKLPMLFATMPRCQQCGGKRFRVYGHGHDTGDPDAETRYVTCKGCSKKFLLVTDYPSTVLNRSL